MITSWLGFGKKTLKKKPEGRKIQKPFSHISEEEKGGTCIIFISPFLIQFQITGDISS